MKGCRIEKLLEANELRRTKWRYLIMALFCQKRAWSVAELHRRLDAADLSTVYRNVHDLLRHNIISRVSLRGEEARYELSSLPHHAHLICQKCGRADCVPCPVKLHSEHRLEMSGLCPACRR
jgi:Fur family ferric uptake transcriptional regulator